MTRKFESQNGRKVESHGHEGSTHRPTQPYYAASYQRASFRPCTFKPRLRGAFFLSEG